MRPDELQKLANDIIPFLSFRGGSIRSSSSAGVLPGRRIDTQYPLRGGGDLSVDRVHSIVEAAIGKPYATIVVAASDSIAEAAEFADFVCDGVADDEDITAAIAAARPGRVLLLEGTFNLRNAISCVGDIILEGQGESTILSCSTYGISASSLSNLEIARVKITGASGDGIFLNDVENVVIHDCVVADCFGTGIAVYLADQGAGCVIRHNHVTRCSLGGIQVGMVGA